MKRIPINHSNRISNKLASFLLSGMLFSTSVFSLAGCGNSLKSEDLTSSITPNTIETNADMATYNASVTDFGIRLFQNSFANSAMTESNINLLVSPISVMSALSMTANGADNETLSQMESTLGMTVSELNSYLHAYRIRATSEQDSKFSLANSIWFTEDDRFTVEETFLQTVVDYYDTQIYKTPFDKSTVKDINNWIDSNTDGKIPKIIDDVSENSIMYLVNALAFDAEWQHTYESYQVNDCIFRMEDGTEQTVGTMSSTENKYLEDERTTGFIKYYKNKDYAFIALLPKEGIRMTDYIASLDGRKLHSLISNPEDTNVTISLPKFEYECFTQMNEILQAMGMMDAFNVDSADFSNLGSSTGGNIFIEQVLHKTFITVAEKGTKAGAATVVAKASGDIALEDIKQVYLNRPFVYLLIDCENNVPFFIGTVMSINQ